MCTSQHPWICLYLVERAQLLDSVYEESVDACQIMRVSRTRGQLWVTKRWARTMTTSPPPPPSHGRSLLFDIVLPTLYNLPCMQHACMYADRKCRARYYSTWWTSSLAASVSVREETKKWLFCCCALSIVVASSAEPSNHPRQPAPDVQQRMWRGTVAWACYWVFFARCSSLLLHYHCTK